MRMFLTISLLLALPLAALAQTRTNAPLVIVSGGAVVKDEPAPDASAAAAAPETPANPDQMLAHFPANAVTPIDKTGSAKPNTPGAAAPNAISKLWPRDTIPIFMKRCVGLHQEFVQPCNCIITHLMDEMTHDEFMKLTDAGMLDDDQRLLNVRSTCATKPQQHQ